MRYLFFPISLARIVGEITPPPNSRMRLLPLDVNFCREMKIAITNRPNALISEVEKLAPCSHVFCYGFFKQT